MSKTSADLTALADGALMVLFANGDPGAARVLTARLLPRVLSHAARVLGDRSEAEDVAQEAMLRLWRAAADWDQDGPAQPATWLYRVVANLCTDRLRRSGRMSFLEDPDQTVDATPSAEAQLVARDRMAALDAALALLPDRQRQAVVLRHIEGCSNPEIAMILDVGIEAVESLTARGKRALTASLAMEKEGLSYGG